jgi:drug/metabolite transporter (DMT)-like permease
MSDTFRKWAIFTFLALVWGSSFILMKRGLISFDYVQVGLLRMLFATAVTLLFAFRSLKEFRRKDLLYLCTVGLFGNGLPYLLFPLAVTKVDSGVVGILNSLVPLFTVTIGLLFFKIQARSMQYAGIAVGLIGAVWLIAPWNATLNREQVVYTLFPVLATIQYAISINIIGQKLAHLSSNAISLMSFLSIALPALLSLVFLTDFSERMNADPHAWESLGYIGILGVVGTSIAVVLFNQLIKSTTPVFASSITYCVPIVAMFWGVLDGESLGLRHLIGVGFILLGVYLVNVKRQKTYWRGFRVR